MLIAILATIALIASVDWSAIPDKLSEWLDAMDVAAEVRE